MINTSRLLWWGLGLLALGFLVPDSWKTLGEVMKLVSIVLLTASIYFDIRAWAKRRKR